MSFTKDTETTLENFCIRECQGHCCRDMVFNMPLEDFTTLVGDTSTTEFTSVNQLLLQAMQRKSGDEVPPGIYYVSKGDNVIVNLIGTCPNLLPNGACDIYDRRPQVCRDFTVGGDGCVMRRTQIGLITPDSIRQHTRKPS